MAKRINERYSIHDLIASDKKPVKFVIASQARLSARVVELILTIIVLAVISNLKLESLPDTMKNPSPLSFCMFAAIAGLIGGLLGILVHIFPAMLKWKIRSVLLFELVLDMGLSAVWIANIFFFVSQGVCQPGLQSCDQYNLIIAFSAFSGIAWLVSLIFDIQGLVKYCRTK